MPSRVEGIGRPRMEPAFVPRLVGPSAPPAARRPAPETVETDRFPEGKESWNMIGRMKRHSFFE
ncbi:hypothetical protein Pve01_52930 [Planomonospora venezuelensis]|nr:hypothetical protein Pve01_52930 [Planomonospora venezuelensis]